MQYSFLADACDTIILKNGTKIVATITDVKKNKVYFKNCGSDAYFTSVINQADVHHFVFMPGKTVEVLKEVHIKKEIGGMHITDTVFIMLGFSLVIIPILIATGLFGIFIAPSIALYILVDFALIGLCVLICGLVLRAI